MSTRRALGLAAALASVSAVVSAQGARVDPWRADSIPLQWQSADSALTARLRWRTTAAGVAWTELPVHAGGEGARTRVILVRLDPARVRLRLDTRMPVRGRVRDAAWTLAAAPASALVALNAGQFGERLDGVHPWGWTVLDGREWQPPKLAPLATAVVVDSTGRVQLLPPFAVARSSRARGVAYAFQSYPTLLEGDAQLPAMLHGADAPIDLTHRDARLAVGVLRDGQVLLALTRFDAFGPTLGAVPLGLTTPETAALMGALGCVRAVMLDGGISAQLLLRDTSGRVERWRGWRRVPMGLVVLPR